MAAAPLVYKVEDRSILLPYYRRYVCDPFLPLLPRTLSPNTITHIGHALNLFGVIVLVGLWPTHGWPFVLAAITLQIYTWCDNADGAHARRTGQCSAFGEFLDHGLDMLNTTYMAYLTTMALGAPPIWWVLISLSIPAAAAAAYWEQSNTGVFRLGMLNQVESVTVLTIALLVSAIFGTEIWGTIAYHGVPLRLVMLAWPTATIVFGIVRGIVRVAKTHSNAIPSLVVLLVFSVAVAEAAGTGAVSTVAGVALATGGNVYFGMRALVQRLRGVPPKVEPGLLIAALALAGLIAWRLAGLVVNPFTGNVLATLACAGFGLQALIDTREGIQRLAEIDRVPALK